MTFEWEDITDEVREKVFFIHFHPWSTSGFDDTTPLVTAITENGQEYFAKMYRIIPNKRTDPNGHTYRVWQRKRISKTEYEVLDLFLGEEFNNHWDDSEKYAGYREKGQWLCRYMQFYGFVFVRKDFYSRFVSEWNKHIEEKRFLSAQEVARSLLDPQGKLPRLMHSETPAILEDEERLRKAQGAK